MDENFMNGVEPQPTDENAMPVMLETPPTTGAPVMPEVPATTDTPVMPETPPTTGAPVMPEVPATTDTPVMPETPPATGAPVMPEAPMMTGTPVFDGEAPGVDMPEANGVNMFGDVITGGAPDPVKKKSAGKIVGITVFVAAVIAGLVIGLYFLLRKTPEEAVKAALENTFDEVEDPGFSMMGDVLGLEDYGTDDLDGDISVTLESMEGFNELAGSTVEFSVTADNTDDNPAFQSIVAATVNDETLSGILTYKDEALYVELPDILDSILKLDVAELQENLDEEVDEDISLENGVKDIYDEYMGDASKDLEASVTYEKIGRTTITNENGDKVKCTQYTVTVPTEAVEEYITSACDYLSEYSGEYLSDEDLEDMGITVEDLQEIFDSIPNAYSYIFTKDFVLDVYVSKDKAIRLESEYSVALLGADLTLVADFMGDDYVMADTYVKLGLSASGEDDMAIIATYKQADKASDELGVTANIQALYGDEVYGELVYTEKYTKSTGAYEKNIVFNDSDYDNLAELEILGSFNNIVKGKSYDVTLDTINLKADDYVILSLSAYGSFGDLDRAVAAPSEDEVIDITDADDEVIESIINADRLEDILAAWSEVFDFLETDDDDYDYSDEDDYDYDSEEDDYDYDNDYDTEEYDDVTLENEEYIVAINDPEGFIRTYADEWQIVLSDGTLDLAYYLDEAANIDDVCEDAEDTYEYFSENWVLDGTENTTITLDDGTSVECFSISGVLYDSEIHDLYFFYPLGSGEYVIEVNIQVWDETPDVEALANEYINTDIIEVQ